MSQRPTLDPLAPGTFRSLLPLLDELLVLIQSHATSVNPPSSVEASEAVAAKVSKHFGVPACARADRIPKARELNAALETMRTAALDLPGGHHSTGQIESLTAMLGVEAERRR